eukprot:4424982-Alexandrium_andersonii.AAC.2
MAEAPAREGEPQTPRGITTGPGDERAHVYATVALGAAGDGENGTLHAIPAPVEGTLPRNCAPDVEQELPGLDVQMPLPRAHRA